MESVLKCTVCFNSDTHLANAWSTDHNNIKWFYKLKLCVPEVDWLEDHLICKKCIGQLETAYEFRDQCLKSFAIRKYLNKPQHEVSSNGISLNSSDLSMYHCRNCIGHFKSSEEFTQHNISVHFTLDTPYTCASCNKIFKTNLELMQHEIIHFNLIDYKNGCNSYNSTTTATFEVDCQKIEPTTDLEYSQVPYLENMAVQNNITPAAFNCYNCGKVLSTKILLINHLDVCKYLDRTPAVSDISTGTCLKVVNTEMQLRKCQNFESDHNKISVAADDFQDKVKDITAVTMPIEKRLSSIRSKRRGKKKLDQSCNICPVCNMVFNSRYLAKRHIHNVHATEKNFQCEMCDQKFTSSVYLNAHKRYHSGERPHICSFCGKGFITGSDLYHHEKIHANKRAYKCEKCAKAFNTSSDLHKHKLCVHLDRSQWKYVCTFCDRRFPLKTNLDAHTKTHTGERNFGCHLCDRKCVNRSVLMRHVKSHSNVRLYKCSLCQLEYKYQKSLDIHMTKAHGIGDAKIPERFKKYFCHICPKSYFANNKLQKHIRTHTGERPFSCQMCEKRFIDKSYVKQHLKTAHNVTFSQTDT